MPLPPSPLEEARLQALYALRIIDSAPQERFDRITRLATRLFDVDGSSICLLDHHQEVSLSQTGLHLPSRPRAGSFTAAVLQGPVVIEDTTLDLRFHDHPDVRDPTGIRFFAGHPILAEDGSSLGALCIYATQPRYLDAEERALLTDLASIVTTELRTSLSADTDSITGLQTRHSFLRVAEHALASGFRNQLPSTLLYLRLDDWNQFQRRHGRADEDEALLEAGTLLRTCFRGSDVLARLDTGSFCVLLTGASPSDVDIPLCRLAALVCEANQLRTSSWTLSFSAGYSGYLPSDHPSVDALIADAEAALFDLALGRTA